MKLKLKKGTQNLNRAMEIAKKYQEDEDKYWNTKKMWTPWEILEFVRDNVTIDDIV